MVLAFSKFFSALPYLTRQRSDNTLLSEVILLWIQHTTRAGCPYSLGLGDTEMLNDFNESQFTEIAPLILEI